MAISPYTEDGKKFFEVYVNGFDSNGRRIQKRKRGIETVNKAKTVEFEMKRALAMAKEKPVDLRWEEWLKICLKRMNVTLAKSSVINYQGLLGKWVNPHFDGKELREISRELIYEVLYHTTTQKLSENSRKTILKMIRRIFTMAVEEGKVARNPTAGIQIKVPEKEQKVLTNSEAQRFLAEAALTKHRFYEIWVVALFTGMRSGELYALKWSDVDLDASMISVSRQWSNKSGIGPTKSRLNRVVPIAAELKAFLLELKVKRGTEEWVLPHPYEWEQGLQSVITKDFCRGASVTPVKFHDLRATFITNLLSRGVSLARVMSIVGHSQIKTTNLYLRKAGVEVKGATDSLGYEVPHVSGAQVIEFLGRN